MSRVSAGAYGLFRGDRLISHNAVVALGSVAAGLIGLGFQVVISHRLAPSDFGAVFAAIAAITLLGTPASALSLLVARSVSADRATGGRATSGELLSGASRIVAAAGVVFAICVALLSPFLARALTVPMPYILAMAAGIPFAWGLPVLLGFLQGEQRFRIYTGMAVGQAGLKLLAAVGLGLVFGPVGVVMGISLATSIVYLIGLTLLWRRFVAPKGRAWMRPAADYLKLVLPSTIAIGVLLNADVLVVKHFFSARDAGDYAAVAAMCRAIYWGATGVAAVLFPKIAYRYAQGHGGHQLVGASLLFVGLGALAGFAFLWVTAPVLLTAFAGSAYVDGAKLVAWYAFATSFLGASAVLIATHQSRARTALLAVLVPFAVFEPAVLLLFHKTMLQVVQTIDVTTGAMFVALAMLYLVGERQALGTSRIATSPARVVEAPANL